VADVTRSSKTGNIRIPSERGRNKQGVRGSTPFFRNEISILGGQFLERCPITLLGRKILEFGLENDFGATRKGAGVGRHQPLEFGHGRKEESHAHLFYRQAPF